MHQAVSIAASCVPAQLQPSVTLSPAEAHVQSYVLISAAHFMAAS